VGPLPRRLAPLPLRGLRVAASLADAAVRGDPPAILGSKTPAHSQNRTAKISIQRWFWIPQQSRAVSARSGAARPGSVLQTHNISKHGKGSCSSGIAGGSPRSFISGKRSGHTSSPSGQGGYSSRQRTHRRFLRSKNLDSADPLVKSNRPKSPGCSHPATVRHPRSAAA